MTSIAISPQTPPPTTTKVDETDVAEPSVCLAPTERQEAEVAVCYGPQSEFVTDKSGVGGGCVMPPPPDINLTMPYFKGGGDIEKRIKGDGLIAKKEDIKLAIASKQPWYREQVAAGVQPILVQLPKRDENGQPSVTVAKNGDMMMGNGEVINPEGKTIATLDKSGQFTKADPKTGKQVAVSMEEQIKLAKEFDPSGKSGATTKSMPLLHSGVHLELDGFKMNASGEITDPAGKPYAVALKDKMGRFTGQFAGPEGWNSGPVPADQQAALWRGMLAAKVVSHDPGPPQPPDDRRFPPPLYTHDDSKTRGDVKTLRKTVDEAVKAGWIDSGSAATLYASLGNVDTQLAANKTISRELQHEVDLAAGSIARLEFGAAGHVDGEKVVAGLRKSIDEMVAAFPNAKAAAQALREQVGQLGTAGTNDQGWVEAAKALRLAIVTAGRQANGRV